MIRTQIYLDEGLQQALRSRSAAEGRSVAALIREAVAHFLKPKKRNFKPRN
jgi:plasmid stability protein